MEAFRVCATFNGSLGNLTPYHGTTSQGLIFTGEEMKQNWVTVEETGSSFRVPYMVTGLGFVPLVAESE